MSVLSDGTIRELLDQSVITVEPALEDHQIQPCTVDLRLHPQYKAFKVHGPQEAEYEECEFPLTIYPGQCILASTLETVELPNFIVAKVEGKSTWGRRFIVVHHTAGLLDPGFKGQITLEIKNQGPVDVVLSAGDLICQLEFQFTDEPVLRPYGHPDLNNHYQNQEGATPPHKEGQHNAKTNNPGSNGRGSSNNGRN